MIGLQVSDLMRLHEMTDRKLPIVFDFHHYRFCPGVALALMPAPYLMAVRFTTMSLSLSLILLRDPPCARIVLY